MTKEEFIKMIPAIEDIHNGCRLCIISFLNELLKAGLIEKEWVTLVDVYGDKLKVIYDPIHNHLSNTRLFLRFKSKANEVL